MGDSSPSGSAHRLEPRAEGLGVHSGDPDVSQSGLVRPASWGGTSWQDPKNQEGIRGLVTPRPPVTLHPDGGKLSLPILTSVRKSVRDAPATPSVTNQGIRIRAAGSFSLASHPSSKPAVAGAPDKVLTTCFLSYLASFTCGIFIFHHG